MEVHIFTLLKLWESCIGDDYRFGAEVDLNDPDPEVFDCSELIQWGCAMAGVVPEMPDGSFNQWAHCKKYKCSIGVKKALVTKGALLFRFRKGKGHVAVSLGNNTTLEAKGRLFGVDIFHNANHRTWTHGALIPGVDYV